jgi:hypothetical protein
MRVVLAGCFVFALLFESVVFIRSKYPDGQWPWWSGPMIVVILLVAVVLALFLFNSSGFRPVAPWKSTEELLNKLREKGLLLSEPFTARRAFQVEEFEDEGSHYFIELDDARTLYLNGQYLYDFEPISDDPELNQPRRFPCTEFTILRHKEEGYVVDILCTGTVLEPELLAPPFSKEDWKRGIPEDGAVSIEPTYDEIKSQRMRAAKF